MNNNNKFVSLFYKVGLKSVSVDLNQYSKNIYKNNNNNES